MLFVYRRGEIGRFPICRGVYGWQVISSWSRRQPNRPIYTDQLFFGASLKFLDSLRHPQELAVLERILEWD